MTDQQGAAAMSVLEGLPMWGSTRVVDMEIFKFGQRTEGIDRQGRATAVGDHALHVQCSWRILRGDQTVVGYRDEFDPESSSIGQRDRLLRELLQGRALVVDSVEVEPGGFIAMRFLDGMRLEVLPDRSEAASMPAEHWRFLSPGSEEPHLVYYSTGLSLD
jgi:hypothetical protein